MAVKRHLRKYPVVTQAEAEKVVRDRAAAREKWRKEHPRVLYVPKVYGEGEARRVKQSMRDECDINLIMKKFTPRDLYMQVGDVAASYMDVSSVGSYHEAMNIVLEAQQAFSSLSSGLRARFENDPSKFMAFCSDEKNRDEMAKLGLLKPEVLAAMNAAKEAAEVKASVVAAPGDGGGVPPSPGEAPKAPPKPVKGEK